MVFKPCDSTFTSLGTGDLAELSRRLSWISMGLNVGLAPRLPCRGKDGNVGVDGNGGRALDLDRCVLDDLEWPLPGDPPTGER